MLLETPLIIIRNLILDDLTDFHRYRSNPEVTKYQGFDVMNLEQARQFIEFNAEREFGKAGEWVQFAIESKASKQLVGDCAIKFDSHDTRIAEIGITISHLEQKKGFAKEAMLTILKHLFDELKIHRIEETVDAENIASIKLLESCGFRKEGYFIENIFFKGKWGSEYKYAMLNREWNDIKN